MIQLSDLRARPEYYQRACDLKRIRFSVQEFLILDSEYRALLNEVEVARAEQNRVSKELPKLSGPEKTVKLAAMKELATGLKEKQEILRALEEKWHSEQLHLPSPPRSDVPEGKDDSENVPLREWGTVPNFSFKPRDHVELGTALNILDIERGVKVAGARNYFLMNGGVQLQHALQSYGLDFLAARNYSLMAPPHIVKYDAMVSTGYFPGGEDMAYRLDDRDADMYLIGTSEVPLCAFHSNEILAQSDLPKRYAGLSPCYRREAGTYGKDTHGLYRVHQFAKIEQVIMCEADTEISAALHEELLRNAEEFLQSLGLPYRVVVVCTGDMGQGQVYKNDIECWMPSRNGYGETHSCSTFYDFQARRLGLRFRDASGKTQYCHTLNNTLVATPRVLIPLLEVHQQQDGSVKIPEVLRPYMGGKTTLDATR